MRLSKEEQERLAQIEKDGEGDWGTDDENVKLKQSQPLGVISEDAQPVTDLSNLEAFEE